MHTYPPQPLLSLFCHFLHRDEPDQPTHRSLIEHIPTQTVTQKPKEVKTMQRAFSLAAVLLITAPTLHANVATGNLARLFEMEALPLPHDWVRQVCTPLALSLLWQGRQPIKPLGAPRGARLKEVAISPFPFPFLQKRERHLTLTQLSFFIPFWLLPAQWQCSIQCGILLFLFLFLLRFYP